MPDDPILDQLFTQLRTAHARIESLEAKVATLEGSLDQVTTLLAQMCVARTEPDEARSALSDARG